MKKIIALLLAVMMVLALCACGDKEETPTEAVAAEEPAPAVDAAVPAVEGAASGEPAVEGAASGEPAVEGAASGEPAAAAVEDTFAAWKEYAAAYATAGAPTEEEKTSVANAILACSTYEEVTAISQMSVLLENVILSYDAWVEAGCPAADTSNMTAGDPNASGEASGEATAEPAA